MYETRCQSRFDARYWMLGLVHWDDPEGWYAEGGGRRVQDGEHVYLWWIHFDIWQNQYNYVKFKNKIKLKKNVFKGYYLQIRSPVSLYKIVPILPKWFLSSYSSVPLMKKESLD